MIFNAANGDGTHPRPQLVRTRWVALDRVAGFGYDDGDRGRDDHWETSAAPFVREIALPFAPESAASGIGDTSFHPIVWYRIPLTPADITAAGFGEQGDRVLLHFGAVDYTADVWVDGVHVAAHTGGQTPFSADITAALADGAPEHWIVVRAEDDPLDREVPRGKQGWRPEPHEVWYERTTGIWRTVWLEAAPATRIADVRWTYDDVHGSVEAMVELNGRPKTAVRVAIDLGLDGVQVASATASSTTSSVRLVIRIDHQRNGLDAREWLWSPERPTLLHADIRLVGDGDAVQDSVGSYLGLRTVGVDGSHFLLNDRPYFVRAVLEQAYWPTSHFTPPSVEAMRAEVQLIKDLGFNCARVHQKVEDPRLLFWADRLGLLIWGEIGAAYEFSTRAVEHFVAEWTAAVRRDRSHPSIVTWVPFNESWGISEIAGDADQRAFVRGIVELTRSLDPTRPVVANDGWEQIGGDLQTIHDYEPSGAVMAERYGDAQHLDALHHAFGPAGRRLALEGGSSVDRPVLVSEFGGIALQAADATGGPDYSTAVDAADLERRLRDLCDGLAASPLLAGGCYTQLTDTAQERNGLCDEQRRPKFAIESIRAIVGSLG